MTYAEKKTQIKNMVNDCCRVFLQYERDHDPRGATERLCELNKRYGMEQISGFTGEFAYQISALHEIYKKELQEEQDETGKGRARQYQY